jgi:hypothetical protein
MQDLEITRMAQVFMYLTLKSIYVLLECCFHILSCDRSLVYLSKKIIRRCQYLGFLFAFFI